MTDAELAKAVADACGIEVEYREAEECWFTTQNTPFDPATYWPDAISAFVRRVDGITSRRMAAFLSMNYDSPIATEMGAWETVYKMATRGPRAICEAILAVKGVQ